MRLSMDNSRSDKDERDSIVSRRSMLQSVFGGSVQQKEKNRRRRQSLPANKSFYLAADQSIIYTEEKKGIKKFLEVLKGAFKIQKQKSKKVSNSSTKHSSSSTADSHFQDEDPVPFMSLQMVVDIKRDNRKSKWHKRLVVLEGSKLSFYKIRDSMMEAPRRESFGSYMPRDSDYCTFDAGSLRKTEVLSNDNGNLSWNTSSRSQENAEHQSMEEEIDRARFLPTPALELPISSILKIVDEDQDNNPLGLKIVVELANGKSTWCLRMLNERARAYWVEKLRYQMRAHRRFSYYKRQYVIGYGSQGVVRQVVDIRNGKKYAVKSISVKDSGRKKHAKTEISILKELAKESESDNIIRLVDVYEDNLNIHMLLEMCSGGDLYERLKARNRFSEQESKAVMKQLFGAVAELHSRNILHLDLKLENVVFSSMESDDGLKIIDFSLSRRLPEDSSFLTLQSAIGSMGYMAPEALAEGKYSKAADIWSCATIMYILLTGRPPFKYAENKHNGKVVIFENPGLFDSKAWNDSLSADAKDLLTKMFRRDSNERITIQEVLAHPWMN